MSNIELHQQAHWAMSEEGADAAAALFADSVVYTDAARRLTLKDKGETTRWLREWKQAFSDARVTEASYLEAGDWTIARSRDAASTTASSGRSPLQESRWTPRSASCCAGRTANAWRARSTTTPPRP